MYRGSWCVGLRLNDKRKDLTAEKIMIPKWILVEINEDCWLDLSAAGQKHFADSYKYNNGISVSIKRRVHTRNEHKPI